VARDLRARAKRKGGRVRRTAPARRSGATCEVFTQVGADLRAAPNVKERWNRFPELESVDQTHSDFVIVGASAIRCLHAAQSERSSPF